MTNFPPYYEKYALRLMRFALVMLALALLSGILFQESSRKAPFSEALPPGVHLEAIFPLSLVHGHIFLIGFLIPTALVALLVVTHLLNRPPVSEKKLKWGTRLYLPSAATAVALLLYKGYHYLLSVRFGETDFQVIDATLFGGLVGLRHGLYGTSHTLMSVGLIVIGAALWKALRKPAAPVETSASHSS